ncbi:hypothetical protein [Adhaeretor mobilis]|nr:hypothetical protein [Adhaeretor mobilis]
MTNFSRSLLTLSLVLSISVVTTAQDREPGSSADGSEENSGWYYEPATKNASQPTFAQRKSMVRAEQRMARLAAAKAYGFSPSRPTATGIAFTSMYSPAWQMPGGRPFGWFTAHRPIVVVSPGRYR